MLESNEGPERITLVGWLQRDWTLIVAAVSIVLQVAFIYTLFATH